MKQVLAFLTFLLFFSSGILAVDFEVNGVYTAWLQSQHAFTLNDDSYDDNYAVQMLRFNVQAKANENIKVVTRFDIAQGWWGVDNADRTSDRTGKIGGSSLFDFKDTNFLFHVDQAYLDFICPNYPLNFRVGRMWYGLGNKIMVDNNYDGIQVDLNDVLGEKITLGYAKVSEGADNTSDLNDKAAGYDYRDADLFTVNFHNKAGNFSYDAYGFYYMDQSIEDMTAYVPDMLNFFKTRFSPQITQLTAVGLAATWKKDKLTISGEFDYLTGADDIENTTYGNNQMWDINDGTLTGYNAYFKANYAATDKLSIGVVGGLGSGDDDLTGGAGNVNKLRTSGFFYITEIWEDSIMPDEEGITPQGLGAPNVRAYRELENTTIFQVNGDYKFTPKFSAFLSYSYIMASQDIAAWSHDATTGTTTIDNTTTASDLGQEVDFRFSYKIYDELSAHLRGGYFMPGDAAGYLINGNSSLSDPAWELKGMILYKF